MIENGCVQMDHDVVKKFYRVTCYTPFCGEESVDYIVATNEDELHIAVQELCYENGANWYDEAIEENYYMTKEEYYDNCGYHFEEIDLETFLKESE